MQINNETIAQPQAAQPNATQQAPGAGAAGLGLGATAGTTNTAKGLSATAFLNFYQTSVVPKHIEKYTSDVTDSLAGLLSRLPTGGLYKLDRKLLSVPNGSVAFVTTGIDQKKYAVILVFKELLTVDAPNHEPPAIAITQATEALLANTPEVKLRNAIIVTPDMYERVDQMSAAIIKSFIMRVDPQAIATTARTLTQTLEFVVGTDLDTASRFEATRSPHGIRPTADIGLWVGIRQKRTGGALGSGILNNNQGSDVIPFLSILAMIDVAGPIRGSDKMIPVVRITDVTTDVMHPGVLYMGLQLAVEYFANKQLWKQPLHSYGKEGMNIGTLSKNSDGKSLYRCPNESATSDYIAKYLVDPLVCVDVAIGRFRIPELFDFTQEDQSGIKQSVSAFFGGIAVPAADQLQRCSQLLAVDYIGYYGQPTTPTDSRMATYLRLTEKGAVDDATKRVLLAYGQTQERANLIASLSGGTFVPLYLDYVEVLNGAFISWVAGAMNAMQIRLTDPNGNAQAGITLSAQIGLFGDYSGVSSTMSSPGRTLGGFAGGIYG